MATFSLDLKIRLFNSKTLKLVKVFDESIENFLKSQSIESLRCPEADIERRVKNEQEIHAEWEKGEMLPSMSFDETGN